jgi:lysophospholipase L1-like esterase
MHVLLAGDSTVASCPAGETPMSGWGAHLGAPLNSALAFRASLAGRAPQVVGVVNVAKGGANTSSFRGEGLWDALLLASSPGDLVVIQFGHNDQKIPTLAPRQGFAGNLERFVEESRERGLRPVLCTSVARRRFVEGRLVPTLGDYPETVLELGSRLAVPVVDLHAATSRLYEAAGEEKSRALFTQLLPDEHPLYRTGISDDTHFSITGAETVAHQVASALVPIIEEAWA